jgi:hypothetical protein
MVRILERDPVTGAVTTFEYDEAEDRAVIKKAVDVEPILDLNQRLRSGDGGYTGWTKGRMFRHAASIPIEVVEMWRIDYGVDATRREHWPAVRRLLNSNEWRKLRVAEFEL